MGLPTTQDLYFLALTSPHPDSWLSAQVAYLHDLKGSGVHPLPKNMVFLEAECFAAPPPISFPISEVYLPGLRQTWETGRCAGRHSPGSGVSQSEDPMGQLGL